MQRPCAKISLAGRLVVLALQRLEPYRTLAQLRGTLPDSYHGSILPSVGASEVHGAAQSQSLSGSNYHRTEANQDCLPRGRRPCGDALDTRPLPRSDRPYSLQARLRYRMGEPTPPITTALDGMLHRHLAPTFRRSSAIYP